MPDTVTIRSAVPADAPRLAELSGVLGYPVSTEALAAVRQGMCVTVELMMTRLWRQLAVLMLAGATVGCDRVTKHMAATTLAGTPARSFLADTIRLEYVENPGGFLSLGANLPPAARTGLLTFGTALLLLVMIGAAVRLRGTGWPFFGLSLYIAGGASNVADRLTRGSVIDFMNVGVGPLRTGIFNVADMAIMLGIGVLLLVHVRRGAPWVQRRQADSPLGVAKPES